MKKVARKPVDEIWLSDLTDHHIIGVEFKDGTRALVVKIEENRYSTAIPGNNVYDSIITFNSIKELLSEGKFVASAYVFSSSYELLHWLLDRERIN